MIRYIIKRLLFMIPILVAVAILIFALMDFIPGDPIEIILGESATPVQIEEAREYYGLNKPFMERLGEYLSDLFFHLKFGKSYLYGIEVGTELMTRFPRTLIIALCCCGASIILGVPIGIYSAMHSNKLGDRVSIFCTILLDSIPHFWLALLLVLLLSLKLGWLPTTGHTSWKHYIIPTLANMSGGLAGIARQTRSSMLEVIRADYVTTARAKGLKESAVTWKHALPNALIPIITIAGSHFGHMLGGATVIENIFMIPGIGSYLVLAVSSRDYPIVQGCVVYIAFTFSIMMLITDLLYAFVDPRIKSQYVKKKKAKKMEPSRAVGTGG